jgi:hypothetical protein
MKKLLLSTMAAASLMANDAELQSLKNQMEQMSQMMKSMQNKIDTLENSKPQSVKAPEATSVVTESTTTALMPALIKDFMPASGVVNNSNLGLSLIVDASVVSRSKKDEELAHMGLPGIAHSLIGEGGHEGHNHATYDAQNGFNLNYAELGFTGTVDPYLDASVFLHFYDGGVEVEEAYFTSRNLPYNLRLRGGKFLSDFGRQNNQHHHAWQFSDMPLVYEAFLGNHGIQEIGAQLQWIAPTSNYLMFGLEALQGKNEMMFGHEAIANPHYDEDDPSKGPENLVSSSSQPSLFVGYVKTSADIGDTTILAGASIAQGETRTNHLDDGHAFSGESTLYGLDLTVKHFFDSYSSLTWQTEWLYRDIKGTEFDDNGASIDMESLRKQQAGYYTQLVYAPDQSWRMGLKYDNIYKNDVIVEGANENKPQNMNQYTAMVEYHSSEFARYRLQYSHSNALFNEAGDQRQNLDSLIFSVNIALGRHNAHPF